MVKTVTIPSSNITWAFRREVLFNTAKKNPNWNEPSWIHPASSNMWQDHSKVFLLGPYKLPNHLWQSFLCQANLVWGIFTLVIWSCSWVSRSKIPDKVDQWATQSRYENKENTVGIVRINGIFWDGYDGIWNTSKNPNFIISSVIPEFCMMKGMFEIRNL